MHSKDELRYSFPPSPLLSPPPANIWLPPDSTVSHLGAEICLPGCGQLGHSIRRRGQGLDRVDCHHHRLPVDLVRHPAAELHSCQQVRNQRTLLVRGWRHHPDHHLLHPLHHAQDQGPRCKNLPPGDQSPLRSQDPPGLLHLRLLHQPHRDDVPHRGRNCSPEQPCG